MLIYISLENMLTYTWNVVMLGHGAIQQQHKFVEQFSLRFFFNN
jgi:hypothetical protein